MKQSKFSTRSSKLYQFTRNSHTLFAWTDIPYAKKSHYFISVTHLMFGSSHFVFATGDLENQENIVKLILDYLSKHKEVSDKMFKDELNKLVHKYKANPSDFYCATLSRGFN